LRRWRFDGSEGDGPNGMVETYSGWGVAVRKVGSHTDNRWSPVGIIRRHRVL